MHLVFSKRAHLDLHQPAQTERACCRDHFVHPQPSWPVPAQRRLQMNCQQCKVLEGLSEPFHCHDGHCLPNLVPCHRSQTSDIETVACCISPIFSGNPRFIPLLQPGPTDPRGTLQIQNPRFSQVLRMLRALVRTCQGSPYHCCSRDRRIHAGLHKFKFSLLASASDASSTGPNMP
jgi:hypothetical protein